MKSSLPSEVKKKEKKTQKKNRYGERQQTKIQPVFFAFVHFKTKKRHLYHLAFVARESLFL